MSEEKIARIEEKIEGLKEKIVRIENETEQLSDIKSTVENINTKLDERTDNTKEKFRSHEKRLDRFGLKFWGIVVLLVSGLVKFLI